MGSQVDHRISHRIKLIGTMSLAIFLFSIFNIAAHADSTFVNRPEVREFIGKMVKKHNFKQQQLMAIFSAVRVRPQVIQHVKKPLEQKPWYTYQMLFVNEWRIEHGVKFWNKYADVLRKAEKIYGVPASIIVATIGIETKYGQRTGEYRVIDSLTNLGFSDSPRAPFFRKELEQFLLLAREQHLDPLKVMGSYAGAIGQPQFMPSSYRHYAINFSQSGKIDLMDDEVDVIGSIANYYSKYGWKMNEPVAIQAVTIGDRYNYLSKRNKIKQPFMVSDLVKYGLIPKRKISFEHQKIKVIELESHYSKEYWLGFRNFDVIKRYNSSNLYAMAVFQLSTYIQEIKDRLDNGQ